MSDHFAMDPESLQTFLANAFAVQESGLDTQALAALIEVQRFTSGDEVDLNRVMRMIAHHALKVCDASGVIIGLLEGGELVYRAASGSAVEDLGRRVPAVFSVSSLQMNREILRVENAGTNTGIPAEICRQFGAMALLMLPIYKNQAVAGVLQVLFDAPHSFLEHEVRTYRMMIKALEEAMLRRAEKVQKPENVQATVSVPKSPLEPVQCLQFAEDTGRILGMLADGAPATDSQTQFSASDLMRAVAAKSKTLRDYVLAVVGEMTVFSKRFAAIGLEKVSLPRGRRFRNAAAVICATAMLAVTLSIAHHYSPSRASSVLPVGKSHDAERGGVSPAASEPQMSPIEVPRQILAPNRGFKKVRVGPNEIDYVSDDVTIRHFDIRPATSQSRRAMREVKFGKDVTVRYFPKPAVDADAGGTSELRSR